MKSLNDLNKKVRATFTMRDMQMLSAACTSAVLKWKKEAATEKTDGQKDIDLEIADDYFSLMCKIDGMVTP